MKFLYSTLTEDGGIETVVEIDGKRQIIKGEQLDPATLEEIKKRMKPKPFSVGCNINSAFCNTCGEEIEDDHKCKQ